MRSFAQKVYTLIKKIPKGKVTTYKIVAEELKTKAYKAVGYVLNKNKDFKNIPCHRVVKSNSEVGGYINGTKKKIEILKKEGVNILNDKVKSFDKYLYKF